MFLKADKEAKTPRGITVCFNGEQHVYWHTEKYGKSDVEFRHVSVTQLVGKFVREFDEDGMAGRCAAKSGVKKADVLAAWKNKRDAACDLGTRTHAIAEDCILGRRPRLQPRDERERGFFRSAWMTADGLRAGNKVIGAEMLVSNTKARVSGQIDLALRRPDGSVWLIDWKTNERIRHESERGALLLSPLDHLQECEANKYSLQLSAYEWILRSEGYIRRDMPVYRSVFHFTAYGAQEIKLDDRFLEVRDCVIEHLSASVTNLDEEIPF